MVVTVNQRRMKPHAHPDIFSAIKMFKDIQMANYINMIQRAVRVTSLPPAKRYANISCWLSTLNERYTTSYRHYDFCWFSFWNSGPQKQTFNDITTKICSMWIFPIFGVHVEVEIIVYTRWLDFKYSLQGYLYIRTPVHKVQANSPIVLFLSYI